MGCGTEWPGPPQAHGLVALVADGGAEKALDAAEVQPGTALEVAVWRRLGRGRRGGRVRFSTGRAVDGPDGGDRAGGLHTIEAAHDDEREILRQLVERQGAV